MGHSSRHILRVHTILFSIAIMTFGYSSCATTGRVATRENQQRSLPTATDSYQNILVHRGLRVAIPDDWLFYTQFQRVAQTELLHFSNPHSTRHGVIEFIDFQQEYTGLTMEHFLSGLERISEQRADRVRWVRYHDHTQDIPVELHVLEEFREAELFAITAVAVFPSDDQQDPLLDAVVLRLLQEDTISVAGIDELESFSVVAATVLSGLRFVGREHNGRYRGSGPSFSALGSDWSWLSDVPGGFFVYRRSPEGRGTIAGIWCEDPRVHTSRIRIDVTDEMLQPEMVTLYVGPAAAAVEFASFFRPGDFVGLNRAQFAIGSFSHQECSMGIFLLQDYPLQQVPPTSPITAMLATPELTELFALLISIQLPQEVFP